MIEADKFDSGKLFERYSSERKLLVPDNKMFVGSDWKAIEACTIKLGEYQELKLQGDEEALPPTIRLELQANTYNSEEEVSILEDLRLSMRSRLAMLGLDVAGFAFSGLEK